MSPGCAQGSGAHRLAVSTESFNRWRIKVCWVPLSVSFLCVRVRRQGELRYFTLCVRCVRCPEQLWHWLVSSSRLCPSGLQHVRFSEGLRGAAVLHPEEAVLAEWPPLWGPPLPRHRWLAVLPGEQDRTCGLEEASGKFCAVQDFLLMKTDLFGLKLLIAPKYSVWRWVHGAVKV